MALLEVGRVIRPHGLRGEVVVDLSTNRLERLAPGSVLVGFAPDGDPNESSRLEVVNSRPQNGRYLVQFVGPSNRDDAERLRNVVLKSEAVEDPSELFVHDLIGATVVDQHEIVRGSVVTVQANPASDLLVLDSGALVPLRFVVAQRDREIRVETPDGLFD